MNTLNKRFIFEAIEKVEIALTKELEVYTALLNEEKKKVDAIVDARIQDIDLYINRQMDIMKIARDAGTVRKKYQEDLGKLVFPRCEGVTLKAVLDRLPIQLTIKIAALRIELNSVIYRLKRLNKLVPRIMEEGMDIYKKSRDILSSTKKIGYNNRGKESAVTERIAKLVDRQV